MDWWVYGTIWFIVWVVCLWLVWRMVDRKDLNRAGWIVLTIFFPIIGLIIVALLPPKRRPEPPEMLP
jgi:cell division protein FtsW (lipid II flippase)